MQPSRILFGRPLGRWSTALWTTSRPVAAPAVSQAALRSTLHRQPPSHQTRLLRTTSCRQASSDTALPEESSEALPDTGKQTSEAADTPPLPEDSSTALPVDHGLPQGAPLLWDVPADYDRTPTLSPPWRPRDLQAPERRLYETHGPAYLEHAPSSLHAFALRAATKRESLAADYQKRFGAEWYEIVTEAKRRSFELNGSLMASKKYQKWASEIQETNLKMRELVLSMRETGQKTPERRKEIAELDTKLFRMRNKQRRNFQINGKPRKQVENEVYKEWNKKRNGGSQEGRAEGQEG